MGESNGGAAGTRIVAEVGGRNYSRSEVTCKRKEAVAIAASRVDLLGSGGQMQAGARNCRSVRSSAEGQGLGSRRKCKMWRTHAAKMVVVAWAVSGGGVNLSCEGVSEGRVGQNVGWESVMRQNSAGVGIERGV
jgi:hypothetical protein